MRKIRVVMVGNLYLPNQFSRALSRYPEVVLDHESGDRKGTLPLNYDAAFLCLSHMSHAKYWQAKNEYKAAGVPTFAAMSGFSEVKAQFEEWLDGRIEAIPEPTAYVKPPPTALELAMAKALKEVSKPPETAKEKVMPTPIEKARAVRQNLAREARKEPRFIWVSTYIIVRRAAGDRPVSIANFLNRHGNRTAHNKPWSSAKVSNALSYLKNIGFAPKPEVLTGDVPDYVRVSKPIAQQAPPKPPIEAFVTPHPAPTPPPQVANDTNALAQLLLDAGGISSEKKLAMLKELLK